MEATFDADAAGSWERISVIAHALPCLRYKRHLKAEEQRHLGQLVGASLQRNASVL